MPPEGIDHAIAHTPARVGASGRCARDPSMGSHVSCSEKGGVGPSDDPVAQRITRHVSLGVLLGWPQRSDGPAPEADALSTVLRARGHHPNSPRSDRAQNPGRRRSRRPRRDGGTPATTLTERKTPLGLGLARTAGTETTAVATRCGSASAGQLWRARRELSVQTPPFSSRSRSCGEAGDRRFRRPGRAALVRAASSSNPGQWIASGVPPRHPALAGSRRLARRNPMAASLTP